MERTRRLHLRPLHLVVVTEHSLTLHILIQLKYQVQVYSAVFTVVNYCLVVYISFQELMQGLSFSPLNQLVLRIQLNLPLISI